MQSPCIAKCFYDHKKDHCTGCFRNLEEIGKWWRLTDAEKKVVLEGASRRRETGLENQGRRKSNGSNPSPSTK